MDAPDVPELSGVHLLFHEDWYDGPLTGLAAYQGEVYFYAAVWDADADDWTQPRRLLLRKITDAEVAEEWRLHRAFEEHVGTLYCAHDGVREHVQRPQSEWAKFYDAFPVADENRYADRPVVGAVTI